MRTTTLTHRRATGGLLAVVLTLGACASSSTDSTPDAAAPDARRLDADDPRPPPPPPRRAWSPAPLPPAYDPGPATDREPLALPEREWAWVPLPRTRCLDGSSSGVLISAGAPDAGLILYLQEGGACFNEASCSSGTSRFSFGAEAGERFAERLDTYTWLFTRGDASNPFRDWTFVFVPYCSGDVFAGDVLEAESGFTHVGAVNMRIALERLTDTFEPSHVLLTGSSAGGFGAAMSYERVHDAFVDARVTLLDDSGTPLHEPYMPTCLQRQWRDAWGLTRTLPSSCEVCREPEGGGLVGLLSHLAERYPAQRFGLMTYREDYVIRLFFSMGYTARCDVFTLYPPEVFVEGVGQLEREVFAPHANLSLFVAEGAEHMLLPGAGSDPDRAFVRDLVFGE
ncbi:MAG: pectin acetylesterase-family hydrolase [Sandaracinaceae bacterium]